MSMTLKEATGMRATGDDETHPELAASVDNTVDLFDAAAHLESMGFGGRSSVRHGYASTFAHADALVRTRLAGAVVLTGRERTDEVRTWRRAWSQALARSLTMLCGVLICIATVTSHNTNAVFTAGAVGWLAGQLVSATMWQGLSSASRLKAKVNGACVGSVSLLLSAGACLVVDSWVPLLWALWSCAISALVVIGSPVQLLVAVLPCAALTGVLLVVEPGAATVVSRVIVVGFAAVTGYIVTSAAREQQQRARSLAREVLHPVLAWSTLQTLALITQLMVLVAHVGNAFTLPMAIAGLAASAACEPVLDSALLGAKRLAFLTDSWRQLRWMTAGLGILAVGLVCGVGLIAAFCMLAAAGGDRNDAHVFLPAVLITALATTGSGVQLRTGNALGAAAVAAGSLAVVLVCLPAGDAVGLLLASLVLFVTVSAVTARRTSHSANW